MIGAAAWLFCGAGSPEGAVGFEGGSPADFSNGVEGELSASVTWEEGEFFGTDWEKKTKDNTPANAARAVTGVVGVGATDKSSGSPVGGGVGHEAAGGPAI